MRRCNVWDCYQRMTVMPHGTWEWLHSPLVQANGAVEPTVLEYDGPLHAYGGERCTTVVICWQRIDPFEDSHALGIQHLSDDNVVCIQRSLRWHARIVMQAHTSAVHAAMRRGLLARSQRQQKAGTGAACTCACTRRTQIACMAYIGPWRQRKLEGATAAPN